MVGTFYHFNDTYHTMIERGVAKPRIYPATENGEIDGVPVLISPESLRQKYIDKGPYIFSCFPANAPILMSDWTERPIQSLCEGDVVVGWVMEPGKKSKLVSSRVLNIQISKKPVNHYTLQTGRFVRCTPDHKWYTGRRGTDGHKVYLPLGDHKNELGSLISVADTVAPCPDPVVAAYLGGIYDGEGGVSAGCIRISQCEKTHPEVCEAIRVALRKLSFDWGGS